MQNDLISRSALIDELWKKHKEVQDKCYAYTDADEVADIICCIVAMIDEQPVAYDVEKVVAELENIKANCVISPADVVWNNAVAMCLKTVRNGGKE